MLQIRLLGGFDVRRDGEPIRTHWLRHSDRLLALLTLNHNRPIRDFWIAEVLEMAESVLPQSLVELYKTLGEDKWRVQHSNKQIAFNTSGVDVDIFTFD